MSVNVSHIFTNTVPTKAGAFQLTLNAKADLDMFTKDNKYGYALNINHDRIRIWYNRFKREKNIPVWCPLSDTERYEFESRIFKALGIEYELLPEWLPNFERKESEEQKEKQPA